VKEVQKMLQWMKMDLEENKWAKQTIVWGDSSTSSGLPYNKTLIGVFINLGGDRRWLCEGTSLWQMNID
jgi:hypothetical protein